jgi:hypothetical protein
MSVWYAEYGENVMEGTKGTTYAEIARRIREVPLDKQGSSYEWEELVQKMCASDDTDLQDIGNKERDVLGKIDTKHKEK